MARKSAGQKTERQQDRRQQQMNNDGNKAAHEKVRGWGDAVFYPCIRRIPRRHMRFMRFEDGAQVEGISCDACQDCSSGASIFQRPLGTHRTHTCAGVSNFFV